MPDRSARSRSLPALLGVVGVSIAGARYVNARAAQAAAPTGDVLNTYCVTCHNSRLKTAGLEIDTLDVSRVAGDAQQWEKIVTKLRTGEMTPPGRPRPDAETYR